MLGVIFYIFLFTVNVVAFGLYGLDKHKAHYGLYRIPEAVLLGLAIIGGAYGAGMGMMLFRHKTLHKSFLITVPVCFVIWTVVISIICIMNQPAA